MSRDTAFISEELCFLAEEELVEIQPTFTEDTVKALTGDLGPFTAGVPAVVPLWAALRLKADQRCRVTPPAWMTVDYLQRAKVEEHRVPDAFVALPFYYIEMSRLLLSSWAREDIDGADVVETLLEDIATLREAKVQRGVTSVLSVAATSDTPRIVDLTHASSMEVNTLRHTFFRALDRIVEAGELQGANDRAAAPASRRGGNNDGGAGGLRSTVSSSYTGDAGRARTARGASSDASPQPLRRGLRASEASAMSAPSATAMSQVRNSVPSTTILPALDGEKAVGGTASLLLGISGGVGESGGNDDDDVAPPPEAPKLRRFR